MVFHPLGCRVSNTLVGQSLLVYIITPLDVHEEPRMFLIVIILGLKNLKHKLDVYLQPLINELKQLWSEGICT